MSELSSPPERDAVEALYREVVLEHYRRPRNREALESPDGSALVLNPTCGDQVRVDVKLDGERIAQASARTRGCSIAVAAGSVMTEMVPGLRAAEVEELASALARLLAGEGADEDLDPRLRAFARVADLPSRRRCAQLPWEALAQALEEGQAEGASST